MAAHFCLNLVATDILSDQHTSIYVAKSVYVCIAIANYIQEIGLIDFLCTNYLLAIVV